jgi:hypothetical protein
MGKRLAANPPDTAERGRKAESLGHSVRDHRATIAQRWHGQRLCGATGGARLRAAGFWPPARIVVPEPAPPRYGGARSRECLQRASSRPTRQLSPWRLPRGCRSRAAALARRRGGIATEVFPDGPIHPQPAVADEGLDARSLTDRNGWTIHKAPSPIPCSRTVRSVSSMSVCAYRPD